MKSNFGEKVGNFFNFYMHFFTEMHKVIKK